MSEKEHQERDLKGDSKMIERKAKIKTDIGGE